MTSGLKATLDPRGTTAPLVFSLLVLSTTTVAAQEPPVSPAATTPGIADNSFLLEEAYNQEFGVVQHISSFTRFGSGEWGYSFTQEWPVPDQEHQLSVTLPLEATGGETGIGDAAINYRFQAKGGSEGRIALSPRVSLLVPTGSSSRGLGSGGVGAQLNLPMSARFGERIVTHSNLGGTWFASAKSAAGHEATAAGVHAGQSLIWVVRPTFNVMTELVWSRMQAVTGPDSTDWEESLYVSPGVRWAHNFRSGLQIVPGVAVPIGIGPSRGDHGILLYLSFEHPFRATRSDGAR